MLKYIPGMEGLYAVTTDGRVWSYPKPLTGALEGKGYTKGKWLSLTNSRGYRVVRLGVGRSVMVHRLVAMTYLGEPAPDKGHVNHKNGDKSDNRVQNLEWCSQAENNRHAWSTGLCRPALALSPEKAIEAARLLQSGLSQVKVGKILGVGKSTIGRVKAGIGYSCDLSGLMRNGGQ